MNRKSSPLSSFLSSASSALSAVRNKVFYAWRASLDLSVVNMRGNSV
jgi:hypothetical protein